MSALRDGLVPYRIKVHNQPGLRVAVDVYPMDVVVKRSFVSAREALGEGRPGGRRGRITGFSRASLRRAKLAARNISSLPVLITLTYPGEFPMDGRKVKRDWRAFKRWLTRQDRWGFWMLEFQKRGAPHFHIWINQPVDRERLARVWFRIVGSGDERHLAAGTRAEWFRGGSAGRGAYVAKYATKAEQKEVPDGFADVGRFWGLFGGVRVLAMAEWRGSASEYAPAVRVIRRMYQSLRRQWGYGHFRDGGTRGFVAWSVGEHWRSWVRAV